MSTRLNQQASLPTKKAVDCAIDAYDVSTLGLCCIKELRTMLRSIVAISNGNELIQDLAKVGVDIADDYYGLFQSEVEDKKKILDALTKEQA